MPCAPETELAWAAGFFDGEGNVRADLQTPTDPRRRPYYYLRIQVSQADPEPLHRLAAAVGAGRVRGPYGPYGSGAREVYHYQVTRSTDVRAVMDKLLPHMSGPKRRQWQAAQEKYVRLNHQSRMDLPPDARGGW